jgi:hypothetical protein
MATTLSGRSPNSPFDPAVFSNATQTPVFMLGHNKVIAEPGSPKSCQALNPGKAFTINNLRMPFNSPQPVIIETARRKPRINSSGALSFGMNTLQGNNLFSML